jgi:hypothetical protein
VKDEQLMRLGEHVAAQEDALPAAEPNESTRRFLAEHAALRLGSRAPRALGSIAPPALGSIAPPALGSMPPSAQAPLPPRAAQRPSMLRPRWLMVSLAAVLVLGVFALEEVVFWDPPLSFTVGVSGESGVLRDWESAPEGAPLPIRFSDGTLVQLEPKTQARVVAVGRAGAEIVIESGRAHVDVVPAKHHVPGESPWLVSLGPFSVEVKGTRFDVGWDPHADDFALDLFEGSVTVRGCEAGQSHTLVAGQGVRASCGKREWTVSSLAELAKLDGGELPVASPANVSPEAPAAPPASELPTSEPPAPEPAAPEVRAESAEPARRAGPVSPSRKAPSTPSWQRLAQGGHYAEAYEVALDAGFERECRRATARDLVLLGDTARLRGDRARAEQAYSAARQRFPRSAAAGNAAFALGRLAAGSDPLEATRWFELYLHEQPAGPLAASADDWLFELAGRARDPGRLREVAETYLQRHPGGAHAGDARRILDAHGAP